MLLCLADFNCTLPGIPSYAPVDSFKPIAGTLPSNARHPDCLELCRIVKQHRLVGLNCFQARQGTFTNGRHSSRIDYVFTRIACVDKYAKEFRPQRDFPLLANQVSYHLPLSSSIALRWHRKYAQTRSSTITLDSVKALTMPRNTRPVRGHILLTEPMHSSVRTGHRRCKQSQPCTKGFDRPSLTPSHLQVTQVQFGKTIPLPCNTNGPFGTTSEIMQIRQSRGFSEFGVSTAISKTFTACTSNTPRTGTCCNHD